MNAMCDRRIAGALLLSGALCLAAGAAGAQPATEDVEVEPLACWWRTTHGSVRVGETFTVVLTCSAIETASTRVIPDQSRLDPAVVQLPPFEVVGGRRANDLRTVGQRFVQYEYDLRLIADAGFARDVAVPSLAVTYRVETQTGQGAASQGREQTYELPPIPVRVESLVPNEAVDIREAAPPTLAEIDAHAFRASSLRMGALAAFGLGGAVLLAGLVRAARGRRTSAPVKRSLSEAAILRGAERALAAVQHESQGGWTAELVGRALAALRVIASVAAGRAVSQRRLGSGETAADGEVVIAPRFSRGRTAVSGSASASSLSRAPISNGSAALVEDVGGALAQLTAAHYGREGARSPEVNGALDSGIRLARRLASERSWLAVRQAELRRSLERLRPGAHAS